MGAGLHTVGSILERYKLRLNGGCLILQGVGGMMAGVTGKVTVSDVDIEKCPRFGQAEGKS